MTTTDSPVAVGGTPAAAGSSFYAAMRILPRSQRQAMYCVYAFCRAVDDIADSDSPRAAKVAALSAYTADIDALFSGGGITHRTVHLAEPVLEFDLQQADFQAVIDGMLMDAVRDLHAPQWDELELYCDRVACAVGRLSVRIFGIDAQNGIELSHHLGLALQLTNILRDVDDDAAMGRLYLPKDALEQSGILAADVDAMLLDPRVDMACRLVAERAVHHFNKAETVMARCPRSATRSPRLMATVYRALLDKLLVRGWLPARARVRHSRRRFIWAVLRNGIF